MDMKWMVIYGYAAAAAADDDFPSSSDMLQGKLGSSSCCGFAAAPADGGSTQYEYRLLGVWAVPTVAVSHHNTAFCKTSLVPSLVGKVGGVQMY
jgi:hypothetical protein